MPVRTIRNKHGNVVGYQAIVGDGGPGKSSYFGTYTHGARSALALAQAWSAEKMASQRRRARPAQGRNRGGVPGLRLELRATANGVPVLYAVATWMHRGRHVHRCRSCEKHGVFSAVRQVRDLREKATGVAVPMSLPQLAAAMDEALLR